MRGRSILRTANARMLQLQLQVSASSEGAEGSGAARKRVAVIGAGWAGLAAAHHLSKSGVDVTLIEASRPGGLVAGWRTEKGRPTEAGIHGFWHQYHNIFRLVEELGLDPFTGYAEQGQYSPRGLEAVWPVFREQPQLPAPLGSLAHTRFLNLPWAERASALPLVLPVLDFDNSDEAWRRYDKLSARELFRRWGVSRRLYREAFEPMLLTGLFAPGENCSAAAAIGMAYFFVLNHQNSFDVRWCRGTVGERIFAPWIARLEKRGVRTLFGSPVSDLRVEGRRATGVVLADGSVLDADAVVFAVGISGLQRIVAGSGALRSRREFCAVANLRAVDALAVRLWLDRKVDVPRSANAVWGFEETTGMTLFDLSALQPEEFAGEAGTVLEVDKYHAAQLNAMEDGEIVERVLGQVQALVPSARGARVADSSVVRMPRAVSHFFPGSYQHLMRTRGTGFENVAMAGDWIVDNEHGSWSQEKAFVTGLWAADAALEAAGVAAPRADVLPVEPDEPHILAARAALRAARGAAGAVLPDFFMF
eukprot:tig00001302_g8094.t1